jgi:hypothetical protein
MHHSSPAICSALQNNSTMSPSGEPNEAGNILSGTEVAKYVLISFISIHKLIKTTIIAVCSYSRTRLL